MSDQAKDECEGCKELKRKLRWALYESAEYEEEAMQAGADLEKAERNLKTLGAARTLEICAAWEQIAAAVDPNPLTSPAEIADAVVAAFLYRKAV